MGDRWMLFDLDGTVLDYPAASRRALDETLAWLGLEPSDELRGVFRARNQAQWAAYERGETTPARLRVTRWAQVLADLGRDGDPHAVSRHYLARLARGGDLVDGARDVLDRLAGTHRIAALTNGFADVQRPRLAAAGLTDVFEVVVVSEEVGASKPDPAVFAAAMAAMGDPAVDDVTFVGDSLAADVAGGVAFGLPTVWFNPLGVAPTGPRPPVRTITRLAELVLDEPGPA